MAFLKQSILLSQALAEVGISTKKSDFTYDHMTGVTSVHGVDFPLTFPRKWYWRETIQPGFSRPINFSFEGKIDAVGGRAQVLSGYRESPQNVIRSSDWGRIPFIKRLPSPGYLRRMSESKFVLCPNHSHWPGQPEHAWSYRFAESVMMGAIPIIFRSLPMGSVFTQGFRVLFDDEVEEFREQYSEDLFNEIAEHNLVQSRKFFLRDDEQRTSPSLVNLRNVLNNPK